MVKVFLTGATGYIGGDLLYAITEAHPDWEVACLIRDPLKAEKLTSVYPGVRVVHGDLDSGSIIEEEAAVADIIYNCANCDHVRCAEAIARGIAQRKPNQSFWIHTSGAGILTHENFAQNSFGLVLPSDKKVYNDWDGIGELTSLPDKALHRHVDKIVLRTTNKTPELVKTAIVCPPCIYGRGRGTSNTTSVQVHVAAQVTLAAGQGLKVGTGANIWHEVHVRDLSNLFILLGEAAASGGGRASWNDKGYYLAENGAFVWGDIVQSIADEGFKQGKLQSSHVVSVDAEEAKLHQQNFPYLCGTTSRGVAERAKALLGWLPTQKSMADHIPEIVLQEAEKLKAAKGSPSKL